MATHWDVVIVGQLVHLHFNIFALVGLVWEDQPDPQQVKRVALLCVPLTSICS